MKRETSSLEFKRELTDTFLKTVSAFANYGGGQVVFGMEDDGTAAGLEDPQGSMLAIENKINNMIDPRPDYELQLGDDNTVTLSVKEGQFKPYLYKNKAFKRNDTSTMTVDRLELTRLILEGSNQDFEDLKSTTQSLSFTALESELKEQLSISALTDDTLKTLQLKSPDGHFNNAAELLSDDNSFPGIDVAVFGDSINEIRFRKELKGASILTLFHQATELFRQYYVSEFISGSQRDTVARIPEKAFRETIANALVHRVWDIGSAIKVAMFADRIEVTSPGTLPAGLSFDDYLHGQISLLRNPIIGTVFFRLGYIERFGTGIARINHEYAGAAVLPVFRARSSSMTVILPIIDSAPELTNDENKLLTSLGVDDTFSRAQAQAASGFSREKTIRLLNSLVTKNVLRREGDGPAIRYILSTL